MPPTKPGERFIYSGWTALGILKDGTEVLRLGPGDVLVDAHFVAQVAFEQPGPGGGNVVDELLSGLIDYVSTTIDNEFVPLFA
jgi:hypothetical protein